MRSSIKMESNPKKLENNLFYYSPPFPLLSSLHNIPALLLPRLPRKPGNNKIENFYMTVRGGYTTGKEIIFADLAFWRPHKSKQAHDQTRSRIGFFGTEGRNWFTEKLWLCFHFPNNQGKRFRNRFKKRLIKRKQGAEAF